MRENEKKERMDADSVIRRLKLVSDEEIALPLNEFKVLEEINYIAQDIHYLLGSFHTEKIYQKAFETELQLRPEQFEYDREFPMKISYKGYELGEEYPDFVLYPNKEYFGLKDELPIIIEMKAKDGNVSEFKWDEQNEEIFTRKFGTTQPRQQLWKYLNSTPENEKVMYADIGILINFSDELDSEKDIRGAIKVGDTEGANLEVWMMRANMLEAELSLTKFPKPEQDFIPEMHFIYETFPVPLSRKKMIDLHYDRFEFNE